MEFGQAELRTVHHHEKIAEMMGQAACRILSTGQWRECVGELLQDLGRVTQVLQVHLYREVRNDLGEVFLQEQVAWSLHPETERIEDDNFIGLIRLSLERAIPIGSLMIITMPINVQNQVWGYLTLVDQQFDPEWADDLKNELQAVTTLIATAIHQQLIREVGERCETLLQIVSAAVIQFLQAADWELYIHDLLRQLGEATKLQRVSIVLLNSRRIFEWEKNRDLKLDNTNRDAYWRLWEQWIQENGSSVRISYRLPLEERTIMHKAGVISCSVFPIYSGSVLRGMLGFDECFDPNRDWSPDEIRVLRIAAEAIGGAIAHQQTIDSLKRYATELELRNQELDAFSHTIAHDLKAPLYTIIGTLRMIGERFEIPTDALRLLQNTEQRGLELVELVTQLLFLARMRHLPETVEPVNVKRAVAAALARHEEQLEAKQIDVIVLSKFPRVFGHQTWVTEIFANLISNSIKYIGENNPTPCIEIRAEVASGKTQFFVVDNGIGIPLDKQETLFKMFSRIDDYLATGHGLGLAIVKRMVTMMDGQIGVESQAGQGSTFWFELPSCPAIE